MNPDDFDEEEADEEELYYPLVREIEARPFTKYTIINFGVTWVVGFFRTGLEAFSVLGDAVLGAEGFKANLKAFEDEVRAELEIIPQTDE